jgi:hypothetical protein
MSCNSFLPFPRGSTATSGDTKIPGPNGLVSTIPTATGNYAGATPFRPDLAGYIADTRDYQISNQASTVATDTAGMILVAGTGRPMQLRAVQAAAAITIDFVGQLVDVVGSAATEFGVLADEAPADGGICKPIDGAYPKGTVIAKWDWFWVVESGPCYVTGNNSTSAIGVGVGVASYGTDGTAGLAAAGEYVVGANASFASYDPSDSTTALLIEVNAGLARSDPAS